jgi:predicted  nucleic acid-binding Zn-ribbon protein
LHPDVRKLLALQKLDQRIAKIRRDFESVPAETARRERALDAIRRGHEEAAGQLQRKEVEARGTDASIASSDAEIRKLEVRLNTVRNNAEYQATLLQIESVRNERNRLEEAGLGLLEEIEVLRGRVAESSARLAGEEKSHAEYLEKARQLEAERRAQLDEVTAGRGELLADIPPDLIARYERMFQARDGLAVAAVEGNFCTGCHTSIPPNLQVKLQAGSSVVHCGTCQRILYMHE